MSTTNSDGKPRSNTYAKACQKQNKNSLFLHSHLQHINNIDYTKLFYNAHIKLHIDYASVVWDGCGEVHLKKLNSLHRRAGRLILPDPSLSTEQKMSAPGISNLPQQLAYNKGIFMHKVLNNNSPDYLAQLFISHQSHYINFRNNLYVPRPRLDLFKNQHILRRSVPLELPPSKYKVMYFSSTFKFIPNMSHDIRGH